jgi:hypothetical protein
VHLPGKVQGALMQPFEQLTGWAGAVVVLLLALLLEMMGPAFRQPTLGKAVVILEVRGVIDPVAPQYIKCDLDTPNPTGFRLLSLYLNPIGGLGTAMRKIAQAILNFDIPLTVYVESSGLRYLSFFAKTRNEKQRKKCNETQNTVFNYLYYGFDVCSEFKKLGYSSSNTKTKGH